jgi:hypothetical protein
VPFSCHLHEQIESFLAQLGRFAAPNAARRYDLASILPARQWSRRCLCPFWLTPQSLVNRCGLSFSARTSAAGPMRFVRDLRLALFAAAPLLCHPAQAQTGCVPIPNLTGPSFTYNCPLLAAGLDRLSGSPYSPAALSYSYNYNPVNFYVSPLGNDQGGTNQCLSSSLPCQTINHALTSALQFDALGGDLIINLAAGTYTENLQVSGPIRGQATSYQYPYTFSPLLRIVGAGSGSTTINAPANSNCYTILVNAGANVAITGVTVGGANSTCSAGGSDLYVQFNGILFILSDVVLTTPITNGVMGEENAVILVSPGQSVQALTFAASMPVGVALSAHSLFQADSTITFSNSPSFSTSFLNADGQSHFKLSASPPTTGSFSGRYAILRGLSDLLEYNAAAAPGGSNSLLTGGSRMQIGAVGLATIGASIGLGSTGTAAVVSGSQPYSGRVILSPSGSGLGSSGTTNVNFAYDILQNASGTLGQCVESLSNYGTAGWSSGALGTANYSSAGMVSLNWTNNSIALASGSTYSIDWVCSSD